MDRKRAESGRSVPGLKSIRSISLHPQIATLDFQLPPELEAAEPPEARGLRRDQVRLMVSYIGQDVVRHTRFHHLPDLLDPGDLLVVNTSGTMNAAFIATRQDGTGLELHLSTHLPGDLWTVELRQPSTEGTLPFYTARPGERLQLSGGGWVDLLTPYLARQREGNQKAKHRPKVRLWLATLHTEIPLEAYLERFGFPIHYSYVKENWPSEMYQTVYATEKGSAEMPSAGRAFTPELLTRLMARGVQVAPLLLHTGVSSLEDHEPPYEEFYRVPEATAQAVNAAKEAGKRVIAVGTTVVRALETVTSAKGRTYPGEGWTSLVVTPERSLHAVQGLLTGLHEPRSTHLSMLEALAGEEHIRQTYAQALEKGYLWHEFGDLHLILP